MPVMATPARPVSCPVPFTVFRRIDAVRRRAWLPLLLAALLVLPAFSAWAGKLAVVDDRGRHITLTQVPQRIVSLLPSSSEAVCALGACDRLVGVDRFSDWPPEVRTLPQVGDLEDARLERIVALRPDLVLAGAFARASDRLESLDIPVLVVEAHRLDDIGRVLTVIATALGVPDQGERLWQSLNERIDRAAAEVPPAWHGARVYFEVAPGPFAASDASYIGQLISRLGLVNVVPASYGAFPKINPEFVVRAQPDLIIASQRDFRTMPARPGWDQLDALRHRRVCRYDENFFDALLRPGPRIGEAADAIVTCLVTLDSGSPGAVPEVRPQENR